MRISHLVVSLLAIALLLPDLAASPTAPTRPDWTEPYGGPGHFSSSASLRAPMTAPVERWSRDLGPLLGEPVVSSGVVYVVSRSKKGARLHALDLTTGETLDSEALSGSRFGHVSVLGSAVVAVTDEAHYYFDHRGKKFKRGRVVRGAFLSAASLLPGLSAVARPSGLCILDLRSGKVLHESPAGPAKPLVVLGPHMASVVTVRVEDRAEASVAVLDHLLVGGAGTSSPTFALEPRVWSGSVVEDSVQQSPRLVQLNAPGRPIVFLAAASSPVLTSQNSMRPYFFGGEVMTGNLPAVAADPVVVGGQLYGRTVGGMVLRADLNGTGEGYMEAKDRPKGGVDGPITAAGGVLLMGNWALELESRRILWVAPDMKPLGPVIPVADGTVLYESEARLLVCAHDVNASAQSGPVARPELPTALTASPDGDNYGTYTQARRALDYALAEDLAKIFQTYSKKRLVKEARRVLAEANALGLPDAEVSILEGRLAGKSENSAGNRLRQLGAAQKAEAKARAAAALRTIEFAGRCTEASLKLEAGALLASIDSYFPPSGAMPEKVVEALAAAAKASMPGEYPFGSSHEEALGWLLWAQELVPAGARFVDPNAVLDAERAPPIDGQPRPEIKVAAIWRSDTIALLTRNLALVSRSLDPEIVGACLRNGEAAIRTLEKILDNPLTPEDGPLEVRIHKTRSDYLSEDLGEGGAVAEWSLGFYQPWTRVSRFHVPDSTTSLNQGRSLHEVVAHELTHQYIAERWREVAGGQRTAVTPGFWIVEGFARFIEDQSLEIARRGDALDDATVQSVESAAALYAGGGGLTLKMLMRLDQLNFQQLKEGDIGTVQIKSTLVRITHSAKSAFYDQAAALAFFMANRSGPDGRARLLDALKAHYKGETSLSGWKMLGFKTRASMEKALGKFLEDPGETVPMGD